MEQTLDDTEILEKIKSIPSNIKNVAFAYADFKLTNMLKRFDNPLGKRASLFLKNKIFFDDRGEYFLKYSAVITKRGMLIDYKTIYKLKTSGGMVYVYVDDCFGQISNAFGRNKIMCWTGHHFDQFAIRTGLAETMLEAIKKRSASIEKWFKTEDAYNIVTLSKDRKNAYAPHPLGTSIGIISDTVLLRITFISESMLKGDQIDTVCAGVDIQSELTSLYSTDSRY